MATIAGYFTSSSIPLIDIFSFGSPRPGDQTFTNLVDSNQRIQLTRITNEGDYIPFLPEGSDMYNNTKYVNPGINIHLCNGQSDGN